jgi:hypothetical protein
MSAPVGTDDLVQGAHTYLSAQPDILAVLGSYATGVPWLFPHDLWVTVENSQSNAAVITRQPGWTTPNTHNTMRFPRIGIEITCDPLRDSGFNLSDPHEVMRRCEAVYRVFDAHLHRPQSGEQMWGTVRTIACTRLVEPYLYPIADGNGMYRLTVSYGVTEG